ncbi:MAG: serine--tRNA ligase [Candidatus Pacearchaeota archaeon]|nr:MAG: serine--tRNA ligase [Candidatus Pacearchaeota archaeon]
MLDPKFIRENSKEVKEAIKNRQLDPKLVDAFIQKDKKYRELKQKVDNLRYQRNKISEDINRLKKLKKESEVRKKIKEAKEIPNKIKKIEDEIRRFEPNIRNLLLTIPNMPAKDVPIGKSEKDNKIIKKYSKIQKFKFKVKGHEELATNFDLLDIERAAKVSGARFYYLKNEAVILDHALQRFALDFMKKKGYQLIEPPFMLKKRPYEGVAHLETFGEMLYKIQDEDLYLIATAEHPLAVYHMNEVLNNKNLPIKFAGISPCFRKEAGSHGRDTKGIFRVHQFNKVEQFIFCKPEESKRLHKELLKNMEEIYKALKIPYRIVEMCTSELGKLAAKQYDIEAWFPAQQNYREITSCSNCTDYQARRLNIRFFDENGERKFVHTLNATAIPTQRTIATILENYQQKDGSIKIPNVLQKYCGFKIIKGKSKKKIKKKK